MSTIVRMNPLGAILLSGMLLSGPVMAADQPAAGKAQAATPHARIARGDQVELAKSGLTQAELDRLRPGYQNLRPRIRTNAE